MSDNGPLCMWDSLLHIMSDNGPLCMWGSLLHCMSDNGPLCMWDSLLRCMSDNGPFACVGEYNYMILHCILRQEDTYCPTQPRTMIGGHSLPNPHNGDRR